MALGPIKRDRLNEIVKRVEMRAVAHACFKSGLKPQSSEPPHPIAVTGGNLVDAKWSVAKGLRMVEIPEPRIPYDDDAHFEAEMDHLDLGEPRADSLSEEQSLQFELKAEVAEVLRRDLANLNEAMTELSKFIDEKFPKGEGYYGY